MGLPGRLVANAGRAARLGVARIALPRAPFVLRLRSRRPLPELAPPAFLAGAEPALSLLETLLVLRRAARDPEVAAFAVRFEGPPGGLARALSLRRALADAGAREARAGLGGEPLDRGAAGGERGDADLRARERQRAPRGPALRGLFLRELLDKLGVAPEVVRVGDFKSAGEMLTRSALSPEQRAQLEALLDDHFAALVDGDRGGSRPLARAPCASSSRPGPSPRRPRARPG